MDELEQKGVLFKDAVRKFIQWCGEEPYRFCTWGNLDLMELQRNMQYYKMTFPFQTPVYYYDVQKCFAIQFFEEGALQALENAVHYLEIPMEAGFHRALEDARYAALVLKRLDKTLVERYYSVDYYMNPQSKEDELHLRYPNHVLYVSREFSGREELMHDREVCSTRCVICNRNAKRKMKWFASQNRVYFCLTSCSEHGYMIGRIRIKKTVQEQYYAEKKMKMASETEAKALRKRHEDMLEKKRLKRREKRRNNMK